MSGNLFNDPRMFTGHKYSIYMYEQDLVLTNLQWLIYPKI